MKQNFFMLLAAVLLSGASAFAQSGNNGSLMGDVNGDGRVDIVDVTTVIDIYLNTVPDTGDTITYYWYAGQNSSDNFITADNYTKIATQSAFTTKAVNMAVDNYLYIVVPSNKTVEITDDAGNGVYVKYYNSTKGGYYGATNTVGNYYLLRTVMPAAVRETWTVKVY